MVAHDPWSRCVLPVLSAHSVLVTHSPAPPSSPPPQHASATQLVVPFCYGTVAVALPKRVRVCRPPYEESGAFALPDACHATHQATPDAHSHRWMVYVRGPGGEDLSPVVSKARVPRVLCALSVQP